MDDCWPTTCSLDDIEPGVLSVPASYHYYFALTTIPLSLHIYLHRRGVSKPGVFWCNDWHCSVGSFDRASHRPRIRHVCVLAIYQESPPRMVDLLLYDCPGLHRNLCVAIPSSAVMEESTLTTLMPLAWCLKSCLYTLSRCHWST